MRGKEGQNNQRTEKGGRTEPFDALIPKSKYGRLIDHALQAKIPKERDTSKRKNEIWIMESGVTSYMTPHANYLQTIKRLETS